MPPIKQLTSAQESVLLSIWKLNGIGNNRIPEDSLKTDPELGASGDLMSEIVTLQNLGFIERIMEQKSVSLTSLGLAILRQLEEDKLQELK